jgi:hypothetical protein
MTCDEAMQRCEKIIAQLEERYAKERPKGALVGNNAIRVQLELYEYAVKRLRAKRAEHRKANYNFVNLRDMSIVEDKVRYATIEKIKGDSGCVELDFTNKDTLMIFIGEVPHSLVGAGLQILTYRYLQHPDNAGGTF